MYQTKQINGITFLIPPPHHRLSEISLELRAVLDTEVRAMIEFYPDYSDLDVAVEIAYTYGLTSEQDDWEIPQYLAEIVERYCICYSCGAVACPDAGGVASSRVCRVCYAVKEGSS
jgi:hypothetical protein